MRIENIIKKIKLGQNITVAVLGGSITTGYSSSPILEKSWAALTNNYLQKIAKKHNSKITFLNEGVSGTDSAFALARINEHILQNNVDLVILEFAMNDQWLEEKTKNRSYEAAIRKIMNNTNIAILSLFVNERKYPFSSQQKEQEKICNYYNIPFVSWKDELGKLNKIDDFELFFDDEEEIHPNNEGHKSISEFIIKKLSDFYENVDINKDYDNQTKLSPPLFKNSLEKAKYFHCENITPKINEGWEKGSPKHDDWIIRGNVKEGWQTNKENCEIEFSLFAKNIGLTYCESDQFSNCESWVTFENGQESPKIELTNFSKIRNGYFGWAYKEIICLEENQNLTLHIRSKKTSGKYCNFTGILVV